MPGDAAYLDFLRTRNGYDIVSLGQKPGECHLASCNTVLLADSLQVVDQFEDGREVVAISAKMHMRNAESHGKNGPH